VFFREGREVRPCFQWQPSLILRGAAIADSARELWNSADWSGGTNIWLRFEMADQGYRAALATAQGKARRQFSLGERYFTGEGVPQDKAQAARLFRQGPRQRAVQSRPLLL
jgi:TPR repeat protein